MAQPGASTDYANVVLREFALNNLKAVVAGIREYDRQSTAAERAKTIPKGWRPDRLLAAAQWAQIADALRPDEPVNLTVNNTAPDIEKLRDLLNADIARTKERITK